MVLICSEQILFCLLYVYLPADNQNESVNKFLEQMKKLDYNEFYIVGVINAELLSEICDSIKSGEIEIFVIVF